MAADALIGALTHVARDAGAREALVLDPEALLADLGIEGPDRQAMLHAGGMRLRVYRRLVHKGIGKAVRDMLPRTRARLGDDRIDAEFAVFMDERGPRSPYLRDVPGEFVEWASPRWQADGSLPAYVHELARLEMLERAVANDPTPVGEETDEKFDLERRIRCNGTLRIERFEHAIHELEGADDPLVHPPRADICLLLFRRRDHVQRRLIIKPRSSHLLAGLCRGETLRMALFGACEAVGETLDDEILKATAVTLAYLCDEQVLLGPESP